MSQTIIFHSDLPFTIIEELKSERYPKHLFLPLRLPASIVAGSWPVRVGSVPRDHPNKPHRRGKRAATNNVECNGTNGSAD